MLHVFDEHKVLRLEVTVDDVEVMELCEDLKRSRHGLDSKVDLYVRELAWSASAAR